MIYETKKHNSEKIGFFLDKKSIKMAQHIQMAQDMFLS